MTRIAILNLLPDEVNAKKIAETASKLVDVEVCLYSNKVLQDGVSYISKTIPAEIDTLPKLHNFIVKDQQATGFDEILHVVEDTIEIVNIVALDKMVNDLRKMMKTFGLEIWLNTATDGMNFVYGKYNPRLIIEFDAPKWQNIGLDGMAFTSHSNVNWMAYDLSKYSKEMFLFDERFEVRMFMIIEFLARKKSLSAGKLSLNYMNMYPTVKSEYGVFKIVVQLDERTTNEVMDEQNKLFTSLNLDTKPDNLIDNVLETMYKILEKKEG